MGDHPGNVVSVAAAGDELKVAGVQVGGDAALGDPDAVLPVRCVAAQAEGRAHIGGCAAADQSKPAGGTVEFHHNGCAAAQRARGRSADGIAAQDGQIQGRKFSQGGKPHPHHAVLRVPRGHGRAGRGRIRKGRARTGICQDADQKDRKQAFVHRMGSSGGKK